MLHRYQAEAKCGDCNEWQWVVVRKVKDSDSDYMGECEYCKNEIVIENFGLLIDDDLSTKMKEENGEEWVDTELLKLSRTTPSFDKIPDYIR